MPESVTPLCAHHAGEVRMRLVSLHSSSIEPERLDALFACPECGSERRLPLTALEAAAVEAEVA